ncbi:hypothetical protein KM043_012343 [Ampulex compressa]|nr:hypothetical protein KM043_012343 [Ampulex compressa]
MYPWYRDSVAAAAAAGLGGPVGVVGSGFCSGGPGQAGTTIKTESGYSDCMLALDYVQSKAGLGLGVGPGAGEGRRRKRAAAPLGSALISMELEEADGEVGSERDAKGRFWSRALVRPGAVEDSPAGIGNRESHPAMAAPGLGERREAVFGVGGRARANLGTRGQWDRLALKRTNEVTARLVIIVGVKYRPAESWYLTVHNGLRER